MPILTYFAAVGVVLSAVGFFGVDILYPPAVSLATAPSVSREPSKLERAITEQKAERQREAARKAAELQKIETEREAAIPQPVVASPSAGEVPQAKSGRSAKVERPPKHVRPAETNTARSAEASNEANSAMGYAAEPPRGSFPPFARSDAPY